MKICEFTKPELVYLVNNCNFTKEQLELFNLRADDVPFEKCAEIMNISISTTYRINKKLMTKVVRINEMRESGFVRGT